MKYDGPFVPVTFPAKRKVACRACRLRRKVVSTINQRDRFAMLTGVLAIDMQCKQSMQGEACEYCRLKGIFCNGPVLTDKGFKKWFDNLVVRCNPPSLLHCFSILVLISCSLQPKRRWQVSESSGPSFSLSVQTYTHIRPPIIMPSLAIAWPQPLAQM